MQKAKERELFLAETNLLRERFDKKKLLKLEALKEELEKKKIEEMEEVEREIEELAQLRILNTKEYFDLHPSTFRRKEVLGNPVYIGEHSKSSKAWCPHGVGEYILFDQCVKKGTFVMGAQRGLGSCLFENGSTWEGQFHDGLPRGVGTMSGRHALMMRNCVVIYRDELCQGKQIEFDDPTMHVETQYCDGEHPKATFIRWSSKSNKIWRCVVRFHDDIRPREREVDLGTLSNFRILHFSVLVNPLVCFEGFQADSLASYNYSTDVFSTRNFPSSGFSDVSESSSLITGGRRTAEMRSRIRELHAKERCESKYTENVFESRAVGLGAAKDEEDAIIMKELRKKQWAILVEGRKVAEELERRQRVEEEQKAFLAEQMELQKRASEDKRQEQAKFHAELATAVEEERLKWEEKRVK